jgi:hypothetical protein
MEYILAGKEKQADSIWTQWLSNAPSILFRRLLQESHTRNEPKYVENLIEKLASNSSITMSSLGNAYSRLINLHVVNNKLDLAEAALKQAIERGIQKEHYNKNTLTRLQSAMEEAGKEYNYFK